MYFEEKNAQMNVRLYYLVTAICSCVTVFSQRSMEQNKFYGIPQLFSKPVINTFMNERDFAISPDGNEIFYTVYLSQSQFHSIIHCMKDRQGNWSQPKIAIFSGVYSDMEPAFSSDGKKIFFSSNRPEGTSPKKDYDIWFVEKKKDGWGTPQNIGPIVNTSANEFFPSVAANGNLYFTASYEGGVGKEDIFIARWKDGKYAEPIALDTGVNSPLYEFNAFVSPDEQIILFTSYGRKDDSGRGDIYMSTKDSTGKWMTAKNLQLINSDKLDYCPFLSFDKKTLFFTSERHNIPSFFPGSGLTYDRLKDLHEQIENGSGNIYQVSWEAVVRSLH